MLAGKLDRLVSKGWLAGGFDAPRMWPRERRLIAQTTRNGLALRPDAGPKEIARALGIKIYCLPLRGCGGELTTKDHIFYAWHRDPVERRRRIAHGLAHAILLRGGYDHTETDALLLTLDFL